MVEDGSPIYITSSRRTCLEVVGQTKSHLEHELVVEKRRSNMLLFFYKSLWIEEEEDGWVLM
jgi:hypothetical protein